MSGPFKRRPSLKALPNVGLVKAANIQRRQSAVGLKPISVSQQEVPWDVLDRCLLPVIFCHAGAIILSTVLNALHISQVSTLTLFIFFAITTIAAVLFYHNLKVIKLHRSVFAPGKSKRPPKRNGELGDRQLRNLFAEFKIKDAEKRTGCQLQRHIKKQNKY
jgi:hypothetical protein